jgi:hypothetical protein
MSIFAPSNVMLSQLHPLIQKTMPKYGSNYNAPATGNPNIGAQYQSSKRNINATYNSQQREFKEYSLNNPSVT